jgi:hypothetical protein
VDVAVDFHNQACLMTVKVNDKSLNDLLPPKVDSQLIRPQFFPQDFLGGSRFTRAYFTDSPLEIE